MLNTVSLVGNLGKDIELRRTQNGFATATFDIAVKRDAKTGGDYEADWITCVAWRQTAEYLERTASKGSTVAVTGRLQVREYTAKDGSNRKVVEVQVSNAYVLGSKSNRTDNAVPESYSNGTAEDFTDVDTDEDLPF